MNFRNKVKRNLRSINNVCSLNPNKTYNYQLQIDLCEEKHIEFDRFLCYLKELDKQNHILYSVMNLLTRINLFTI
jgi:hypothetical protein